MIAPAPVRRHTHRAGRTVPVSSPPRFVPPAPDSNVFEPTSTIAINAQFAGDPAETARPDRWRPAGTESRSHVAEVDAGEPHDDRTFPGRVDDALAAPEIEPRPRPAQKASVRQQPKLAADCGPPEPERASDVGWTAYRARDQGNDPTSCRIRQELDPLGEPSWQSVIPVAAGIGWRRHRRDPTMPNGTFPPLTPRARRLKAESRPFAFARTISNLGRGRIETACPTMGSSGSGPQPGLGAGRPPKCMGTKAEGGAG